MPPRFTEQESTHTIRRSPGESLQAHPWSFIILGLGAGLAAGYFLRGRHLRRAFQAYMLYGRVRKLI